jgi:hypothetical protein
MDGQFFVTGCTYPAKPIVTTTAGTMACAGDTIVLSTSAQTGVTYQWINGVTTVPGGNTNVLGATTSGAYKVLVNRCGVDSVSDPFPIMIQSPSPSFTYTHNGLDYTFTNNTVPLSGTDFVWSFSDGSPDQSTVNAFRSFAAADTYLVALRATDMATFCTDTFSLSIPVTTDTSDTTDTSTTSIEPHISDIPKEESCYIYPNPVSSVLNIITPYESAIRLVSINGIMVRETGPRKKVHVLDFSKIPDGLYFLQVLCDEGGVTRKIVVQH